MAGQLQQVEMRIEGDEYADASWLEQDGFEDRLAEYRNGEFGFLGVRAVATIHIPHGSSVIIQTIESPGLWGIESDSSSEYLDEVYQDELEVLHSMLAELGVKS